MAVPTVALSNGYRMPKLGFGTHSLKGKEAEDAIEYAIEVGYRHIDTAFAYGNEREVGNAIRAKIEDGTVKREDLFITTKLNPTKHEINEVLPSCRESLKNLALDYVDLYLIHTPVSVKDDGHRNLTVSDIDYVDTWRGMEECKRKGIARNIGVSNFNSEQIMMLNSVAHYKPVNNQIEVSLNLHQMQMIIFCEIQGLTVTGHSPLGNPGKQKGIKDAWQDPKVLELAEKYGKTPAQISLRFVYQMGAMPIPKSATKSRIKENFEIFDFDLTALEMNDLVKIATGDRIITLEKYKNAKYFPFNIPY